MTNQQNGKRLKTRTYETAAKRWAGIGPYYAMFPVPFADSVVEHFTDPGDLVLDPFAGRGTAVFAAASKDRRGVGIEINPVGWVYAQAKLRPASEEAVLGRLDQLQAISPRFEEEAASLPEFFSLCYSRYVLRFLLAVRDCLDWRRSSIDRTVMALLLVYLHGKRGSALSNQLRQTKAMSPEYAVNWWRERGLKPPCLDPVEFMKPRVKWRYAKGIMCCTSSQMYLGDSTKVLGSLSYRSPAAVKLLFTSPPYIGVTNYHYDQWLRLWLLGGQPNALRIPKEAAGPYRGKFEDRSHYKKFLQRVFIKSKALLRSDAVVYVRSDSRKTTYEITLSILKEVFPEHKLCCMDRPVKGQTQTHLFHSKAQKAGEVDFILWPKQLWSKNRVVAIRKEDASG
jgi:hypothetical protein